MNGHDLIDNLLLLGQIVFLALNALFVISGIAHQSWHPVIVNGAGVVALVVAIGMNISGRMENRW